MVGAVLANLIGNGLKFNDSPEPMVEIGALKHRSADDLCTTETGIGIAPEHHETVFAMFRRLHSRKKYEGSGAGFGAGAES